MSGERFLLYGAYGYTGELIARRAVAQGLAPVLAGRDGERLAALAAELGLPSRPFALDEREAVVAGLEGMTAVLHCAGPFAHTARPMVEACLASGVHYLDITGEIEVFEALAARGQQAVQRGVVLLPGVGFDVVPTDCLAAHLARRLPGAQRLALGIQALGRLSHGTATTMVQNLGRGGAVRRDGRIEPVPPAYKRRSIDFGRGPASGVTIPWGDVATAFHSTGIPNIEVYMALPRQQQRLLAASRWLKPILASSWVKGLLQKRIDAGTAGPTAEQRARGASFVWGEVEDADGHRAVSRLRGPEGYDFTAATALAAVERLLAGQVEPGFKTPSLAFGADFVLEIEGVARGDDPLVEP